MDESNDRGPLKQSFLRLVEEGKVRETMRRIRRVIAGSEVERGYVMRNVSIL